MLLLPGSAPDVPRQTQVQVERYLCMCMCLQHWAYIHVFFVGTGLTNRETPLATGHLFEMKMNVE